MSKVRIKTDIVPAKTRNYNFYDMTTLSFYRPQVIRAIEFKPDTQMSLKSGDLLMLKPMVVPVKGNMKLKHIYYFVPFRLVQKSFNSFINGELHHYEDSIMIPQEVRSLYLGNLVNLFVDPITLTPVSEFAIKADTNQQASTWKSDFTLLDETHGISQWWKFRFTKKGRWLYSMLSVLGYKVPFAGIKSKAGEVKRSALPLLCMAKLYLDHMRNTAYNTYQLYNEVEVIINRNLSDNQDLGIDDLYAIVNMLYNINYDNDLFVSAFDNPVGPNGGPGFIPTEITFNELDNSNPAEKSMVITDNDGTPRIIGGDGDTARVSGLSKYILNGLQRLSDYMHRHQIVGHDKLNNYLAQFGVGLKDEQLNLSQYLGRSEQDVVVDQIFSTSDTAGANLGAYAGRGYAVNSGNTNLNTNEFGMWFDIALIVPKTGYYQGEKKHTQHITKLDFFNPTFDGLGNAPISQSEIYVSSGNMNSNTDYTGVNFNNFESVFGYLPRYYEYKEFLSDLSGDFIFGSIRDEMSSWHLFRLFTEEDFITYQGSSQIFDVKHNFNFTETFDRERYERGFYQNEQDNFILITNRELQVTTSMKDLYDFYDYDSIGKEFDVDLSGTNKITK